MAELLKYGMAQFFEVGEEGFQIGRSFFVLNFRQVQHCRLQLHDIGLDLIRLLTFLRPEVLQLFNTTLHLLLVKLFRLDLFVHEFITGTSLFLVLLCEDTHLSLIFRLVVVLCTRCLLQLIDLN